MAGLGNGPLKMLEARGHRFCRYADDCNIYLRSEKAGERVMASVTEFLQGRLHLKVNRDKSAVAPVGERSFLGHRLLWDGRLGIAPKSLDRVRRRRRRITKRNRGISLARMIAEVNAFLSGWLTYFRYAQCKRHLQRLDEWLRHRLRCVRIKHCKRTTPLFDFLKRQGGPDQTYLDGRGLRQGLVAYSQLPPDHRGHAHRMVQRPGPHHPDRTVSCVTD